MKRLATKSKRLCEPLVKDSGAIPFVYGIARSHVHRTGTPVDYEDIVGEGILGLAKAANRYKGGDAKFTTYAYGIVSGAVKDLIRREAVDNKQMPLVQLGTLDFGRSSPVEAWITQDQLRAALVRVITRELSVEEAFVISRSYFYDESNETLAETLRCSVRKIGNVKAGAIVKLRTALAAYKDLL